MQFFAVELLLSLKLRILTIFFSQEANNEQEQKKRRSFEVEMFVTKNENEKGNSSH
jgi:hypothetical protein